MSPANSASTCALAEGPGSASLTAATSVSVEAVRPAEWIVAGRLADYFELAKPRIAAMVLLTVTVGYVLGRAGAGFGTEGLAGQWALSTLVSALVGIALVASAGGAFNQLIERRTDGRMARTSNRPLPAGRMRPLEVAAFGLIGAIAGLALLSTAVNLTTAILSAATLVLYVAVYTPLKRYTALSTAIGAVPGALPPVLGWTASGADLGWSAFSLFAILYVWQFPHFLAIAWLYRRDYANAGLRMLPGLFRTAANVESLGGDEVGPARGVTGFLASAYAAVLIPVSLLPAHLALAGGAYRIAAVVLGFGYLTASVRFFGDESRESARGVLYSSLIYLPVLLVVLTWDHLRMLS